jgi:hypothetical protein
VELSRIAYEAYITSLKSEDPLPAFDDLSPESRLNWDAVAEAVKAEVERQMGEKLA